MRRRGRWGGSGLTGEGPVGAPVGSRRRASVEEDEEQPGTRISGRGEPRAVAEEGQRRWRTSRSGEEGR
jgi:hypothetical protein